MFQKGEQVARRYSESLAHVVTITKVLEHGYIDNECYEYDQAGRNIQNPDVKLVPLTPKLKELSDRWDAVATILKALEADPDLLYRLPTNLLMRIRGYLD